LWIGREELARARQRIRKNEWRPAAERLRRQAAALADGQRTFPQFDTSWYDANPDQDFAGTYVQWDAYSQPAVRLLADAVALLQAGLVLEDARYLDLARGWTMHVADHFKFHVRHFDSGLGYSWVADHLAEVYAALAPAFPDAERQRLERAMAECGEAILRSTEQWLSDPRLIVMPYNNHLAAHRRGLLALALAFGRDDWTREALQGRRNFGELLVGCTRDDGLCYESSTLYHFATLSSMVKIAELVRHRPELGLDLYRQRFANGRSLKQMFDAPLGLLWPNGEIAAMGDCYARRQPLWRTDEGPAPLYEIGYAVYADPHYAWLLRQGRDRSSLQALLYGAESLEPAEPPLGRSRVWIEHGYTLLTSRTGRGYWDESGVAAVLCGDRSGVHHHRGAMSLQVFAAGRLWLEDVESQAVEQHAFSASIQAEFNRTMLAHNLLVVDEADQPAIATPVPVVEFKELPACRAATLSDVEGRLAPGARMIRSVAVTPDFCLDVIQAASGTEHTYDWLVHPRSDGSAESSLELVPTTLPDRPPYSRLRDAASAPVADGQVSLCWKQGEATFVADVRTGQPSTLVRAQWPVKSDWSAGGREMFMVRTQGRAVDVAALYQVWGDGPRWRIEQVERRFNGQEHEMHVGVTNGQESRAFTFVSV
jgi:hypothetical protein